MDSINQKGALPQQTLCMDLMVLAFENFDIFSYIINQFIESNIWWSGQPYSLIKIEHTRTSMPVDDHTNDQYIF